MSNRHGSPIDFGISPRYPTSIALNMVAMSSLQVAAASTGWIAVSANLFLGQYAPTIPGLEKTAEYRMRILDSAKWFTAYCSDGDKALSIGR